MSNRGEIKAKEATIQNLPAPADIILANTIRQWGTVGHIDAVWMETPFCCKQYSKTVYTGSIFTNAVNVFSLFPPLQVSPW